MGPMREPSLKGNGQFEPVSLPFRTIAHLALLLPLCGHEPASRTGVLDRRADGKRASLIVLNAVTVLMIVGGLAVDVTAYPNHPAIAEAPTQGIVGVQLLARAIVSSSIAQIEVIHHLDVSVRPRRIDIRKRRDGFKRPVVAANIGQVIAIVTPGWGEDVNCINRVKFFAVVIPQSRAKDDVPKPRFVLMLTVDLHP